MHWHNTERLHGYRGDVPPIEFENAFYAVQGDRNLLVGSSVLISSYDGGGTTNVIARNRLSVITLFDATPVDRPAEIVTHVLLDYGTYRQTFPINPAADDANTELQRFLPTLLRDLRES